MIATQLAEWRHVPTIQGIYMCRSDSIVHCFAKKDVESIDNHVRYHTENIKYLL